MPAVPSGRACEACRNARKKCDTGIPICGRCIRLNIPCIGSGQRRFLFKGSKCYRKPNIQPSLQTWPNNPIDDLSFSLWRIISPETEPRFSLLQSYGPFLKYLPQHLGKSEALDSATRALVLAHHDICCERTVSLSNTFSYATAITKLKLALGNHEEASSIHSLASATVLVICRDLNAGAFKEWGIHSTGAVEIVKARNHLQTQSEFEQELLWSLQGYVVGHCLFDRDLRLDPTRFEKLVATWVDKFPPDSFIHFICNIPRLIERGEALCGDFEAIQKFTHEVYMAYQSLTAARHELKKLLVAKKLAESISTGESSPGELERGYSFVLALCSIYYSMLTGPKLAQSVSAMEGHGIVQATLDLAKDVESLSPLGSMYMFLPLFAACLATEEPRLVDLLKDAMRKLEKNYHRSVHINSMTQRIEILRMDLQFRAVNASDGFPQSESD